MDFGEQLARLEGLVHGSEEFVETARNVLAAALEADVAEEDAKKFVDIATHFTTIGLVDETDAVAAAWRTTFPELAPMLQVLVDVTRNPASASVALAKGDGGAELQGIAVINAFVRGDLQGALRLAKEANWFVDNLASANGFSYAVWILALDERFDEAEALLERWLEKNRYVDPRADHNVARAAATVASYRGDFAAEVRALEEALVVANNNGLTLEAAFAEAALAAAFAHHGDEERARAMIDAWPVGEEGTLLSAYRALARADVELLTGNWDAVAPHADRVVSFYGRSRNPVLYSHICWVRTLAAPAGELQENYGEFARAVAMLPTRRMSRRLDELHRLTDGGARAPRDCVVLQRSRGFTQEQGVARLWYPPSAITADLYIDHVRELLYVGGRGPFDTQEFPRRAELLRALVDAPRMRLRASELFEQVWGQTYDAGRHENKLHVTVHRLRRMLDEWAGHSLSLIRIREGDVEIVPGSDVRVVSIAGVQMDSAESESRLLRVLVPGVELRAKELERALGLGRTAVLDLLNPLLKRGAIERLGGGRSTRYRLRD